MNVEAALMKELAFHQRRLGDAGAFICAASTCCGAFQTLIGRSEGGIGAGRVVAPVR
jgi:hypothetical protein